MVEIYDNYDEQDKPGAMLYHHSDGYPDFMGQKLTDFLDGTYERLEKAGYPYWWDSERVAAMLVLLSAEDYDEAKDPGSKGTPFFGRRFKSFDDYKKERPNYGVPVFQPAMVTHGDVEYIWKVHLHNKNGKFDIKCCEAGNGDEVEWKQYLRNNPDKVQVGDG
jgi:hypothetical protein